ncbi:helix-turn-helix domain-containing protein [Chloroflexota bacterium]
MAFPEKIKQRAIELYQDCSAAQALKALEEEFPEQAMPYERSIRRWRNNELLREHLRQMARIAALLINGLDNVAVNIPRGNQFDIFKYSILKDDGSGFGITLEQLSSYLLANIETVSEEYWCTGWKDFEVHLSAEVPEINSKGLQNFARANPYELIETLKTLAQRKKFKGKCHIC